MTLSVSARHRLGTFELDASFTSEGGVTALSGVPAPARHR